MNIDYHYTVSSTLYTTGEKTQKLLYVVMYFEKHGNHWINIENHLYLDGFTALQDSVNYKEGTQLKKAISGRTTDEIAEAMQYEIDHTF